jgi:hypothetical protein
MLPFSYRVYEYDPEAEHHNHDGCDAPDCSELCAYVFEGVHEQSVNAEGWTQARTLHYCGAHAAAFAASQGIGLLTSAS